ncbi:MAG TPA: TolC family protein [Ignavibacteria bacterium]|nr:TolC family protein [Ignavibacteria bacterium]
MKRLLIALFLVLGMSLSSGEFLQAQNVRVLDIYEAVSIAKENNLSIKLSKLNVQQAEYKVSEVYSENLVPNLTLTSRYTRAFKKPKFIIFGESFEVGTDNSLTTALQFQESLPILGTPVFSGIRIAEYYTNLQGEFLNQSEIEVKRNVKQAFYSVMLAKQVLVLNNEILANALENFSVVEARYRNGVTTEFDYLRAKVRVENVRPNVSQSEKNLVLAKNNLSNIMGIPSEQQIDVAGALVYDSTEVYGTTQTLINTISERNVLVRQLQISKKINEELVNVNEANYLPKLSVFGNYNLEANENDDKSISEYKFNNSIAAGLSLSWDLNLFRNSYKVQQAEVEIKKNEIQINDLKRNLRLQTENVIVRLEDARNRIRSQYATVGEAARGLELANISYRNGVITQIDVLDANLIYSQSNLAYLSAIYDYLVARADLEALLEK